MRGKLKLGWTLLLCLGVAVLISGWTRTQAPSSEEMRALVRADIKQIMEDIDKDPTVGASSNPWHYVGVSPAFPRLVERGEPALEAIAAEIEESKENGLREYLLAMAGNAILGEKKQYTAWDNAKGWLALYRADR